MRRLTFSPWRVVRAKFVSKLNPCGIIGKTAVESPSKWNWSPFSKQFATIVHAPTLNIPTGASLCPSAAVFARLRIRDKLLLNPPRDRQVYEHCKIEKIMKQVRVPLVDSSLVIDHNENMVFHLATARQGEKSPTRREGKMDMCALSFLQLCGFDSTPFHITAEGSDFKIFGKKCRDGDHPVVVTPHNDLVLIFGNKPLNEKQTVEHEGHVGQIVGEMLQMLSLNRDKDKFRNVFAVRFVNHRVTAFRLEQVLTTLNTLYETNKVPTTKLRLLSTARNPTMDLGLSLIDSKERVKALQMMADIRMFLLNEE